MYTSARRVSSRERAESGSLVGAAALGRGWGGLVVVFGAFGGGRRRGRSCIGARDGGSGSGGRSRGGSRRCDDVVGVAWVVQADDVEDRPVRPTKVFAFLDADVERQVPHCLGVESAREKVVDVVKVAVAEQVAVVDLCLLGCDGGLEHVLEGTPASCGKALGEEAVGDVLVCEAVRHVHARPVLAQGEEDVDLLVPVVVAEELRADDLDVFHHKLNFGDQVVFDVSVEVGLKVLHASDHVFVVEVSGGFVDGGRAPTFTFPRRESDIFYVLLLRRDV